MPSINECKHCAFKISDDLVLNKVTSASSKGFLDFSNDLLVMKPVVSTTNDLRSFNTSKLSMFCITLWASKKTFPLKKKVFNLTLIEQNKSIYIYFSEFR